MFVCCVLRVVCLCAVCMFGACDVCCLFVRYMRVCCLVDVVGCVAVVCDVGVGVAGVPVVDVVVVVWYWCVVYVRWCCYC